MFIEHDVLLREKLVKKGNMIAPQEHNIAVHLLKYN